jgi:hypothetical protein
MSLGCIACTCDCHSSLVRNFLSNGSPCEEPLQCFERKPDTLGQAGNGVNDVQKRGRGVW